MIIEPRAFGYVQEAENTIFKNLITYSINCVKLISLVSDCFYFYD